MLFSLKEKGGSLHPEKFRCKKHNIVFPKIGWGGRGSEAVWKFSENSSNLLDQVIPKQGLRVRNLDIPRVTKNKISTCNNSAGIYSLKTNQWSLTIGQ